MTSHGEWIMALRLARGFTLATLAARAGIEQAAVLRYENGISSPGPESLQRLADALAVTPAFIGDDRVHGALAVAFHMRRRSTASVTTWRRLEARLNVHRRHLSNVMEQVSLRATRRVPTFDPIDVSPADAARFVRAQWRMPIGPVRTLVAWMEAAGCIVIAEDFTTTRVDGLSQWVDDHPVLLINTSAPVDRVRLALAHELGHLCLHTGEAPAALEPDADAFATELLMPAEVIRPQIRNLTLGRLPDLKREWGIPLHALIDRAHHLGMLTTAKRAALFRAMDEHGWRAAEPVSDELPWEEPTLLRTIGDTLAATGLTADEIARLAGFPTAAQDELFARPRRGLRAVP